MVKPSLRAAGADLDRIHFPTVKMDGKVVRLLSAVDEAALTADLNARGITVVFVDPVMSAIGATSTSTATTRPANTSNRGRASPRRSTGW